MPDAHLPQLPDSDSVPATPPAGRSRSASPPDRSPCRSPRRAESAPRPRAAATTSRLPLIGAFDVLDRADQLPGASFDPAADRVVAVERVRRQRAPADRPAPAARGPPEPRRRSSSRRRQSRSPADPVKPDAGQRQRLHRPVALDEQLGAGRNRSSGKSVSEIDDDLAANAMRAGQSARPPPSHSTSQTLPDCRLIVRVVLPISSVTVLPARSAGRRRERPQRRGRATLLADHLPQIVRRDEQLDERCALVLRSRRRAHRRDDRSARGPALRRPPSRRHRSLAAHVRDLTRRRFSGRAPASRVR